jgi:cardiolipin synthase
VRIEFLLPKASDHPLTDAISRSWWGEFQEIEALLWLYPRRIHAKTLVIDRRVLLLGSANMDLRSFRINYECSVVLSDHSLGDRLSRHFDQQKSQSRLSPPRKRTPTARILTSLGRMASPLF